MFTTQVLCEGVTYDNWPWGKQHCNLNFGSWSYDADHYDLLFHDNKVWQANSLLGICGPVVSGLLAGISDRIPSH
jgi:hypothetical protein